jgi:mRNA interferase RelE/StbE
MTYEVLFEKAALRALQRTPSDTQIKIISKIEELAENPRPFGHKKLVGRSGYRIRIGDYRVIYTINDKTIRIYILDIGHRREIYN